MLAGEYLETEFPQESLDDLINNLDLEDKMDNSIQVLEDELNNLTWPNYKHDLDELDMEYENTVPVSQREETLLTIPDNTDTHDGTHDLHSRDFGRDVQVEFQKELRIKEMEIEQYDSKVKSLEKEVSSLKRENYGLKEEQESLKSIKESLKEEKELEILEYKKEILLLKEKQLKEFVQEWNLQKEDLSQKYSMDLTRIQRDFEKDKLEFTREMGKVEAEKDLLQQKLYDLERKSRKMDFECQTEGQSLETPNLLEKMKGIFGDLKEVDSVEELCISVKKELRGRDEIIKDYKAQIDDLKMKEEELMNAHQKELQNARKQSQVKDLESVLRDFPEVHDEFKNMVFQRVEKALAEQRIKNSEYVDQVLSGHQKQISELLKSFEVEKESWKKEKNSEIMSLTTKLKSTCSDAYSSSISRVQSHVEAEKKSLLQEFEHDKELLKDLFSKERESLSLELSRTKQQHSAEIKDLKEKYLVILKQMRADLISSKANTLERLEVEWKRRKNSYEDKIRTIKLHLSTHPTYCKECMDLFCR